MYDTINLWLPNDSLGSHPTSKILENLSFVTEHQKQDGQVYYSGLLGTNYKVSISDMGLSLKGSLAKYFLPDNFHTLTRSDSQRAIEQISDILLLPIDKAKVMRIDFAKNFIMKYEPEAYYSYLGDCQYYNRFSQPKSLYYSNGIRTKLFYNKIAEGKAKGYQLPNVWLNQNILRYEMRYTSRLANQFNIPLLTANLLHNEQFYIKMFDKWLNEYDSINKLNSINFNLSYMNSPKDFIKQLSLYAINIIGQDNIMKEIENLKHQKAFDKPEYYCRLKNEIRDLCKSPIHSDTSELITELDKKVLNAKRYFR